MVHVYGFYQCRSGTNTDGSGTSFDGSGTNIDGKGTNTDGNGAHIDPFWGLDSLDYSVDGKKDVHPFGTAP